MATSPAPPLRFRTAAFRQYGSKPRCVAISHALPPKRPSLSAKSAYPRALPGLTWPSSLMSLLRTPPALVRYRPASGSLSSDHLGPRALCSGRVMLSLPSTLSGPIRQSRPHPLTSQGHWLYRRPCPTTWSGLPPRPSPLWVSTPSTRAITSTPGGETGPYPRCVPAPIAFLIA